MERYDELGSSLYDLRYTDEQLEKYRLILHEIDYPFLVLDNGCGTGLLLPLLETAIGLDLSSVLLEKAMERCSENQYLVQGDSENLPFRDSLFDVVLSVTVLQNLPSPEKLSIESVRVTKPNSTIIISSLKRVYNREKIMRLIENDELCVDKIFTTEKINDWITVSTRKQ